MATRVDIHGKGIASACCAHLLGRAGAAVRVRAVDRPPVPAILLSDPALALMRDVFDRPDLFADRPRIARRVVSWGGRAPVDLPHGAVVVSEGDLEAALFAPEAAGRDGAAGLGGKDGAAPSGGGAPGDAAAAADLPAAFAILTAPPFPTGVPHRFGERQARAVPVRLRRAGEGGTCRIEATANGWLFLIPTGATTGWLLGVGDGVDALLAHSRDVAPYVEPCGPESAAFDTCPRLLPGLCGTDGPDGADWIACGTAAAAFDPICGDGTAQATREAILVAAMVRAAAEGEDRAALRTHYESMMLASMRRHVRLCADFYRTGGAGPWWRAQAAALVDGYEACTRRLATRPGPAYRLQGFRLVAGAAA